MSLLLLGGASSPPVPTNCDSSSHAICTLERRHSQTGAKCRWTQSAFRVWPARIRHEKQALLISNSSKICMGIIWHWWNPERELDFSELQSGNRSNEEVGWPSIHDYSYHLYLDVV